MQPAKLLENAFFVIGISATLLGGVAWLTHIAWISESNAENLRLVMQKQEVYTSDIAEIRKDIAVIKRILEVKEGDE